MIDSEIVTAFPASVALVVAAGESACEEIARKLNLDSQVMSLWKIRAELFQSRRFSGLCGFVAEIVHQRERNFNFSVA
jgi:hypothetical protein